MVTILSSNHLKFKINENDHNPPHVHVEGLGATVRINLITLEVMDSRTDFNKSTVNRIIEFVKLNQQHLLDKWEETHD